VIPKVHTPQHNLARRAVETASSLPEDQRQNAALAVVALWSVGDRAEIIGNDQSVGFVVRIATKLVLAHYAAIQPSPSQGVDQ
jgi:hypothetical protein